MCIRSVSILIKFFIVDASGVGMLVGPSITYKSSHSNSKSTSRNFSRVSKIVNLVPFSSNIKILSMVLIQDFSLRGKLSSEKCFMFRNLGQTVPFQVF